MNQALFNGALATADDLRALALVNYGHFTTLQVRDRGARGIGLHLRRLQDATRELFGSELDRERVRADMRQALQSADAADCTLRVTVFARAFDPAAIDACQPDLLVTTAAAAAPAAGAMRVKTFGYQRAAPHIKHVGTFPLFQHQRMAMQVGFDDALFVDAATRVSEGSVWNLGFWDGQGVTWPQAPALRGTCEQLLQAGLDSLGVRQATREVDRAGIAGFRGAFACNSRGARLIGGVDDVVFPAAPDLADLLQQALDTQPPQRL